MEETKKLLPDDIRQTYFILFEENGMRYIFNRSIQWNSIMSTKNINKIINVLGKEAINNFILRLNKTENKLCDKVNELTNYFIVDETVFTIIEVHPEWENFNRKDQWNHIEPRKDELCKIYNAVKRKDQLANSLEIDKQICSMLKKKFKQWLIEIYDAIAEYAHLINDELIHTSLGATIESLKQEIINQRKILDNINNEISNQKQMLQNNKKKLSNQNYVIDIYNRYINNLDDDKIDKLKKALIYNHEASSI